MKYISNSIVKIGVDLDQGGSITYFSAAAQDYNMINSHDLGREVQMSFYSGPANYNNCQYTGQYWMWNPIESGDRFGNPSKIISFTQTTTSLTWACNNVDCECQFTKTIQLDGQGAYITSSIKNNRSDKTDYGIRDQEEPAIYSIGQAYRLITYTGANPWTHDQAQEIDLPPPQSGLYYDATENWAALCTDSNYGLGVYHPGPYRKFLSLFVDKKNQGGPKDNSAGYIAPVGSVDLQWNSRYTYNYYLILGQVNDIRNYVYEKRAQQQQQELD